MTQQANVVSLCQGVEEVSFPFYLVSLLTANHGRQHCSLIFIMRRITKDDIHPSVDASFSSKGIIIIFTASTDINP